MARGWESKSVESQIESATTDGEHTKSTATDGKAEAEKGRERERQSLLLSRAYLLHRIESSSNEHYTKSLRQALNEIDQKLDRLNLNHG